MTTEQKFLAAVDVITSLPKNGPFQPSDEVCLKFDSYYKQATTGPCNTNRPLFFDQKKREWYAWKSLGNMSKECAMERYVEQLLEVIETMSYTETVSNFIDLMGPFYEIVSSDDVPESCSDNDMAKSGEQSTIPTPSDLTDRTSSESLPEMLSADTMSNESFEIVSKCPNERFVKISHLNVRQCRKNLLNYGSPNVPLIVNGTSDSSHSQVIHFSSNLSTVETLANKRLSTSILNLQRSLNDVMHHIDYLEDLAKSYNSEMVSTGNSKSWNLSPFSLAMVVFWPFVAHWIIHVVQQRRNVA